MVGYVQEGKEQIEGRHGEAGWKSDKNSANDISTRKGEGTARKEKYDDQRNSQHQKGSPFIQLVGQFPPYP